MFVTQEKYNSLQREYVALQNTFKRVVEDYRHIVENLQQKINSLTNNSVYYICIDEEGLESENIYANDVIIFDDYFVFYNYGKVVAVMSKDVWKDVVTREEVTK